jgi:signal transduction histidine kinase
VGVRRRTRARGIGGVVDAVRDALESCVAIARERATADGVQIALSADPGQADTLRARPRRRMLSLTFRPLFELDIVEGDERRIKQVIFNLLSKAVKFMPSGGFVDVSAMQMNGEVHVSVSDTGIHGCLGRNRRFDFGITRFLVRLVEVLTTVETPWCSRGCCLPAQEDQTRRI